MTSASRLAASVRAAGVLLARPAMLGRGYDKRIALGCICAGGGLATLIPPSVVFIMYGLTAGVSIGKLYAGGVIPGLMLAGLYIAYIVIRCWRNPELAPRPSEAERSIP